MKSSGIIYYHEWDYRRGLPSVSRRKARSPRAPETRSGYATRLFGLGLLALALGGLTGPLTPRIRLEAQYYLIQAQTMLRRDLAARQQPETVAPQAQPAAREIFDPLKNPDGSVIEPVDRNFGLVIPKIGVNASVIPAVNPTKPGEYLKALETGVAHSSLSYFPDEDGTVYLFSHSTNYDWFVKDLNAVFYLLKNLEADDMVAIVYKGKTYTYKIVRKQIVNPTDVAYMAPQAGVKQLILQTCWPPGSTTERLLIFADLISEANLAI